MEKLDKVYFVLSQKTPSIYEDIILIDGAIEQINIEYKKEILRRFENKYYIQLNKLKYYMYNKKIEKRIEKDIISLKRELNTKLGTLKLFIIRIGTTSIVEKYELENILEKIAQEEKIEKLDEYFVKLDDICYENI